MLDLVSHLWLPVLVLAAAGIGGTIRVLRANLLDELHRPYVTAARAKGLSERRLLLRYPVRVALNPFISTIGWVLPGLVGGEVIVAKVLGLQTTGPLLLAALQNQDMYLAGSIIMILSRADRRRHADLRHPARPGRPADPASSLMSRDHGDESAPPPRDRAGRRQRSAADVYVAPQWKLVWWRFRRHRLAVVGLAIVVLAYLGAASASSGHRHRQDTYRAAYAYAPPQRGALCDFDRCRGCTSTATRRRVDPQTLQRRVHRDPRQRTGCASSSRASPTSCSG